MYIAPPPKMEIYYQLPFELQRIINQYLRSPSQTALMIQDLDEATLKKMRKYDSEDDNEFVYNITPSLSFYARHHLITDWFHKISFLRFRPRPRPSQSSKSPLLKRRVTKKADITVQDKLNKLFEHFRNQHLDDFGQIKSFYNILYEYQKGDCCAICGHDSCPSRCYGYPAELCCWR